MSARLATSIVVAIVTASGGCANLKSIGQPVADVTPTRQQRREDVVRDFEQQRDQAQLESAIGCRDQGDADGCRKALDALLQRNPTHVEARYLLAEMQFVNEQADQARALLEQLVAEQPNDPRFQHLLGLVLELRGDKEQAANCLLRAVELAPGNDVYRASYEAPTQAPEPHSRVEQTSPGSTLPGPRDASAGSNPAITAAVAALRRGAPLQAVELLRTAAPEQTTSAAYYRTLGTAYYRAANYPAAEKALAQALRLDNASALSYFLMACTLSRLGRAEEAAVQYRQAAALDPRYS